ncbi:3-phosphoshikimate 1-carboxyvinyltransferase [Candidatus Peregrinibacteria bacterium CG_4_10_14_0_2_um_filter_38_24]|nr:MAG: 3-phosphoshikimate 1-carboxyvinyltransferase [Candidatus Peregrinibacteria bacterium CG_4_10_14_0_2_um_filter_38_24]PJC38697.1 MAG: 3-phosphoshikimate 1-carboxyvinyltransferase [Candidatus Peregrinibacteria bacterium CG_4_9_14_0_2_um_filter_38_9]
MSSKKTIKILVPGSKSIAARALILAALHDKKIKIKNIPTCDDTKYLINALKKLEKKSSTKNKDIKIFTGNAGTTTRFLTAFCALKIDPKQKETIIIYGDKRMNERPIKELTSALNQLGAKIETTGGNKKNCPPIKIYPSEITGGKVKIRGDISSQYISALMMISKFTKKKTTIKIEKKLCSKPYIKITEKLIKEFENENLKKFTVESDASSASYIGEYAAINPDKKIILKNLTKNSIQGDIKFLEYLSKMGCKITEHKNYTEIEGMSTIKPLNNIDMNATPDLVMTFSVLAMFANGTTKITHISNLRIKETDRLQALENEIKKFGIKVKTGKDFIKIHGNPNLIAKKYKSPISINTYNDHRIAMAFGVLNSKIPKLKIENPKCVSKSYPTFWKDLIKLQK